MYQFFCLEHDYGWSIDSDGIDYGCIHCRIEEIPDESLSPDEAFWRSVDMKYELLKDGYYGN